MEIHPKRSEYFPQQDQTGTVDLRTIGCVNT
jgi:hypothetical protein